jgi:hypothetical protein
MAELRFLRPTLKSNSERLRTLISISRDIILSENERDAAGKNYRHENARTYVHNLVLFLVLGASIYQNLIKSRFLYPRAREKKFPLCIRHISAVMEVNTFFESKLFLFDFLKGCHAK